MDDKRNTVFSGRDFTLTSQVKLPFGGFLKGGGRRVTHLFGQSYTHISKASATSFLKLISLVLFTHFQQCVSHQS